MWGIVSRDSRLGLLSKFAVAFFVCILRVSPALLVNYFYFCHDIHRVQFHNLLRRAGMHQKYTRDAPDMQYKCISLAPPVCISVLFFALASTFFNFMIALVARVAPEVQHRCNREASLWRAQISFLIFALAPTDSTVSGCRVSFRDQRCTRNAPETHQKCIRHTLLLHS